MMARFSGDALAVTAHMIMTADCSLAKRKHILTRASEGEKVVHSQFWEMILELEGLLTITIPLQQQDLTQFRKIIMHLITAERRESLC